MASNVKSLVLPDGNEYRFYGVTYFGVCSTPESTSLKVVSIPEFNSENLVAGTRIVVRFVYASGTSQPRLNVSSTGAKWVDTAASNTGETSWISGGKIWENDSFVGFVYSGAAWVVEGLVKSSISTYGSVILNNSIVNNNASALTPGAVYNGIINWTFAGEENSIGVINTTTPPAEQWYVESSVNQIVSCTVSHDAEVWENAVATAGMQPVIAKVTYNNNVYYKCMIGIETFEVNDPNVNVSVYTSTIYVRDISENAGVHPLTVEFFYGGLYITYPMLLEAVPTKTSELTNDSGYLTLSTLPIYDGEVVEHSGGASS